MLDFLTSSSSNMVYLSLEGSTPQDVLKNLLDKLTLENLENIVIEKKAIEFYKLVNNEVNQISGETYQIQYKTPSSPPLLSPDIVIT